MSQCVSLFDVSVLLQNYVLRGFLFHSFLLKVLNHCFTMLGVSVMFLAVLGLIAVLWKTVDALWSVVQVVISILTPFFQPAPESSFSKRYGMWAVVTGSTDGIGKFYAKELAKRGLNIVLISRNKEKLLNTASEIEREYCVKTKIIQMDFSEGEKVYSNIQEMLNYLEVGVLVNNVGMQYAYPMYLTEVPAEDIWDIINVNVGAVTMMTKIILPQMKERKKGAIVNISSGSELQPLPLMTVYGATKSYIKAFTAAIRYEYSRHGITIQHLSPLFVSTKMNAFSARLMAGNLFVPNAEIYARHAVATLGKTDCTTGYWTHGIQYFLASLPPVWIRTLIGGHMNEGFREEYFSKAKT